MKYIFFLLQLWFLLVQGGSFCRWDCLLRAMYCVVPENNNNTIINLQCRINFDNCSDNCYKYNALL